MGIEDAFDRLLKAMKDAGAGDPLPPAEEPVAAVTKLIAPLQLPGDLAHIWSKVHPASLRVVPETGDIGPSEFADPALAWWWFKRQIDDPGVIPEALLLVSSVANTFRFVELAGPDGNPGGTVYEWTHGAPDIVPSFASITDWAAIATEVEAGRMYVRQFPPHPELVLDPARYANMPGIVDPTPVPADHTGWPERWRALSRAFDERRRLAPPMRNVSQLLWDPPPDERVARVAGAITIGVHEDTGGRLALCDGTGVLDAWFDGALPGTELLSTHQTLELDVIVGPGLEHQRVNPVNWPGQMWDQTPPQAHVKAMRPLFFR